MESAPNRTQVVALLGRRDEPADGVQDYCECLARGMARAGWTLDIVRVPWPQLGWFGAFRWLARGAGAWRGRWVLVQYTALAWSRRGFPTGLLYVLWILRRCGVRCVVIFHDTPYPGERWIDRVRRNFQTRVMRAAYRWSEHSVLTFDLDRAAWLPASHGKAVFIPVGANVFSREELALDGGAAEQNLERDLQRTSLQSSNQSSVQFSREAPQEALPRPLAGDAAPSLGVFGLSTWSSEQRKEVGAIVHAAREVGSRLGGLRLLIMGRGSQEAEGALREGLAGSKVVVTVCGVLSGREISGRLMACDAALFIRRGFSTRRSTGLAAIACGVPMVAYRGEETGFPLTEGGIVFVREDDLAALADEVTRVLQDGELRSVLGARNEALYREWFSWDRIAQRVIALLDGAR